MIVLLQLALDLSLFGLGYYDTQRAVRDAPDCRGRLRTDKDGRYSYRAVVPVAYPIPGDVSHHTLPREPFKGTYVYRVPLGSYLVCSSAITCVPIIYTSWSKRLVITS